ncbi:uncharacterized protein YlxW (UPF0749 family) [Actinomadura luteofluorescens]|uniref:Uncharacterized protein YlxW (UPF0749 family) n=1 Tax=Actinomadura luteofluorescens TaxID=46163 RepID=A0A7Y9ERW3_9ACTN|nr:DUF881 domain-containing protein [Actinomadura luteofluorescens]NYD52684.1 uncharacterized protein YlxW (UPF0749 family) [Actinomadura luteofluorescens]
MIARQDEPGGREPDGRPDASMSLLADLFAGKHLDPGYAAAAARRAASGGAAPRPRRLRGAGVLLVLALAGALAAVAGVEAHRGEPVAAERRSKLVDQIHARTAETDALQHRLDRLRADTERRRAAALARSAEGRRVRRAVAAAGAAAAATPAAGEGLVVALDDAPAAPGRAADAGRVYDQDLQVLVNGLWAAGARAIGVNGQRLTPTTAIRAAGEAIMVDYRPLDGPYEVTALGDAGRLRAAFAGSSADRRLAALRDRFGIRYGTRRSGALRLPAAGAFRPRYAVPRDGGGR